MNAKDDPLKFKDKPSEQKKDVKGDDSKNHRNHKTHKSHKTDKKDSVTIEKTDKHDIINKKDERSRKFDKINKNHVKAELKDVKKEDLTLESACKKSVLPEVLEPLNQSKTEKYIKIEKVEKMGKTPEKVVIKLDDIVVNEPVTPPLVNLLNPEVPETKTPDVVRTLTPELPKVSKSAEKLDRFEVNNELIKPRSFSPLRPIKMMNICSFLSDIETGGFPKAVKDLGDLSPLRFDDDADKKEDFEYKMHW